MKDDIQEILDLCNGSVVLPSGEFSGPFIIDHPCTIEGSDTTLWNEHSTVLKITCSDVVLKNLRIELINGSSDNSFSIDSAEGTVCENVEIIGPVSGFGEEDKFIDTGKQIKLDSFAADEINSFIVEIYSASDAEISSDIADISFEPSVIAPGLNKIRLTVNSLPHNTYLYGKLLIKSAFIRRYYISGHADSSAEIYTDKAISAVKKENDGETDQEILKMPFEPDTTVNTEVKRSSEKISLPEETRKQNEMINNNAAVQPKPQHVNVPQSPQAVNAQRNIPNNSLPYRMIRGDRILIGDIQSRFKIIMGYRNLKKNIVLDPYVFLLNGSGVTSCDEDFVYFGNTVSGCGSVTINSDKTIDVDLLKVPDHIKRISLVYSIYLPGINDNFAQVNDPYIRFFQNGKEMFNFIANDLLTETTMIFTDFYKYNNTWKLSAVGFGYREGLKKLCSTYGLIVT